MECASLRLRTPSLLKVLSFLVQFKQPILASLEAAHPPFLGSRHLKQTAVVHLSSLLEPILPFEIT